MPTAPFSTAPPQDVGKRKPHAERGCAGEDAEFALPVPERLRFFGRKSGGGHTEANR
jgi:hypothetical protein